MEKKIEYLSPPDLSHFFHLHDEAIAEIREVTGISGALLGDRGENMTGAQRDAIIQQHVSETQRILRLAWAKLPQPLSL